MGISKSRFPVLKVDVPFEVLNGLCGMKRDIILRLCGMVWSDNEKVKGIIGMCREHFTWKQHLIFIKNRPFVILYALRPQSIRGYVISFMPAGQLRCSFTEAYESATVFNDARLAEGVFQWTIQISYTKSARHSQFRSPRFYVGATPSDLLNRFKRIRGRYGSAAFHFQKCINENSYNSGLMGVYGAEDIPDNETKVPDNSLVSIEADCTAHTLAFFYGRKLSALKKVPRVVSGIRVPLHLMVEGTPFSACPSFVTVLFCRLPSATPSAVVSTVHEMKK